MLSNLASRIQAANFNKYLRCIFAMPISAIISPTGIVVSPKLFIISLVRRRNRSVSRIPSMMDVDLSRCIGRSPEVVI